MKSQPAKVLAPMDLRRLLATVAKGRYGVRNRVVVLLSVKAGLRACEIANLTHLANDHKCQGTNC